MGNQQQQNEDKKTITTQNQAKQMNSNTSSIFSQQDQSKIIQVFQTKTGTGQLSNSESIQSWFNLTPESSEKLIQWIQHTNGNKIIDSQQWLIIAEILIKDNEQYQSKIAMQYRKLKKLDLFFHIFLFPLEFDEDTSISTEQALLIFQVIFGLCHPGGRDAATLYMNRIYDDSLRDEYRVSYLISRMNSQMPIVANILKQSLQNLFMNGQTNSKLPALSEKSTILNDYQLLLLSCIDNKIANQKELTLLYSNHTSGSSFNRLAWNIIAYGGATLIIIKLNNKSVNFRGSQWPIIYGAYNPQPWTDGFKFQGDSGCYLFQMGPCFRQFTTYGSRQGQNYAYLNTKFIDKSKYRVGLGFGGQDDYSQFRFWLDDDLENNSQVNSDDQTYQIGYVAGEIEGRVSIDSIEIWGLGGEEALIKQQDYRRERQEELERMRKVDKKAFFNAFDQEFFMAKTFAHRDQVREEDHSQCLQDKDREPLPKV